MNITFFFRNVKKFFMVLVKLFIGFSIAFPYLIKKETYLINLSATGDTVFLCGILPEYKKLYAEPVKILSNIKHKEIVRLFGSDDDFVYISPKKAEYSLHFFIIASFMFRHIVFCRPYKSVLWPDRKAAKKIAENGILTMYKRELKLSDDCMFHEPRYPGITDLDEETRARLTEIAKPNTVILAPTSISLSNDTIKPVMRELAQQLSTKGYNVYTNGRAEESLPGTKPLLLSYCEMAALASMENITLVAARSGLCDVLAFTDFNMIILYPSEESFGSYSLMKLFQIGEKCFEIVVPECRNCLEEIERRIPNENDIS